MTLRPRRDGLHPPPLAPAYRSTRLRAPRHAPLALPSGPAEESGPVFGHDLIGDLDADLIRNFSGEAALGERIIVHGTLRDEDGRPVPDALVEIGRASCRER